MITEAQERLLNLLQFGKENAVTRDYLSFMLDRNDREIRRMIEELRQEGYIICSSTQHKGYWKPTKRSEVNEFIIQMDNYAKKCFKACQSAKEYMKNHEDQLHA